MATKPVNRAPMSPTLGQLDQARAQQGMLGSMPPPHMAAVQPATKAPRPTRAAPPNTPAAPTAGPTLAQLDQARVQRGMLGNLPARITGRTR